MGKYYLMRPMIDKHFKHLYNLEQKGCLNWKYIKNNTEQNNRKKNMFRQSFLPMQKINRSTTWHYAER
jgi:hypothetical protein